MCGVLWGDYYFTYRQHLKQFESLLEKWRSLCKKWRWFGSLACIDITDTWLHRSFCADTSLVCKQFGVFEIGHAANLETLRFVHMDLIWGINFFGDDAIFMLFCSCNDVLWQMFFCFLHLLYSPSNSGAGAVKRFLLSACWFSCRLSLVHIVNVIRTAYMTIKILRFGVCKEFCFLFVLGFGRVVVSIAILNFNHQNICCSFFFSFNH